jgi:hypothetical protein
VVKIDQAFVSEFVAGGFGLPIAHENLSYDATEGEAYAEISVLQNNVTPLTLNSSDQTDGIFQVVLRYPANSGAIAIKQKADEILNHFRFGKTFKYGGVSVKTTSLQRQPGINEAGWYKIILTIAYTAILTRSQS